MPCSYDDLFTVISPLALAEALLSSNDHHGAKKSINHPTRAHARVAGLDVDGDNLNHQQNSCQAIAIATSCLRLTPGGFDVDDEHKRSATSLSNYILTLLKAHVEFLEQAGKKRVDPISGRLARLHDAIRGCEERRSADCYERLLQVVEDFTSDGVDPFEALLEDLRELGAGRAAALAKLEKLREVHRRVVASAEMRRKVAATAFWIAMVGVVILMASHVALGPVASAAVGAAKGAMETAELSRKAKEDDAKKRLEGIEKVAREVASLERIEEELRPFFSDYERFKEFVHQLGKKIKMVMKEGEEGGIASDRILRDARTRVEEQWATMERMERVELQLGNCVTAVERAAREANVRVDDDDKHEYFFDWCFGTGCGLFSKPKTKE